MSWKLAGLVILPVLFAGSREFPDRGPVERVQGPLSQAPSVQEGGVIRGVLRVRSRPPRRTVNRYGAAPHMTQVQEIPPVVFLEGSIGQAPAPVAEVMAQRDTVFDPALLVVPVGSTVEFPNEDTFFHNVFSYSATARFDLGRYPRGESKEVTFDEPGLVRVYCEVHESMRSAILVVQNRFWAVPDEDGSFRLEGIPAGTYTLRVWHADHGDDSVEVTVPASGAVDVELEL